MKAELDISNHNEVPPSSANDDGYETEGVDEQGMDDTVEGRVLYRSKYHFGSYGRV